MDRTEIRGIDAIMPPIKLLFFEIPLLIESNLMKNFDIIFLIKANKKTRIKRFVAKGGNPKFFETLNKKQLDHKTKAQFCRNLLPSWSCCNPS